MSEESHIRNPKSKILDTKKPKIFRKKTITTFALILMLTMTAFTISMNLAKSATTYPTAAYLSANPNPAQVNKQVFVSFWLQPYSPGIGDLVYHNLTVTITDPTGRTENKGPYAANPNGGGYFIYVPTKVGNYSFKFSYPGENFPSVNRTYSASETPNVLLRVEETPIQYKGGPGTPLPTDYWTRPISAEMREWSSISGNWLMGGYDISGHIRESAPGFNPYSTAPKSAHIMWTKPAGGIGNIGGLVGGERGDKSYYSGGPYYSPVYPPIILDGKLIYNMYESSSGNRGAYGGFVAVDLRTGQELWRNTTGYIDVAQTWYVSGIDEIGAYALLWSTVGSTWTVSDPSSGQVMFTFANASTANYNTYVFGKDGTLFTYILYNAVRGKGPTLLMWNSSKALYENGLFTTKIETSATGSPVSIVSGFVPRPGTFDWRKGIEWNITEPVLPGGDNQTVTPALGLTYAFVRGAGDVLLGWVGSSNTADQIHVGYSATNGSQLWVQQRFIAGTGARGLAGSGIYGVFDTVLRSLIAYNINTGQQLWTSDPMKFPWGAYTSYSGITAYGLAYALGYDGYAYAYNLTDGKTAWEFYTGDDPYGDTPYGLFPVFGGPTVAGNVVFFTNGEHSPNMPLYRGEKLFANDAITGKPIWNISAWAVPKAIADGYLVTFNLYDNQIYTFGKGPSKTTVSAPQAGVTKGSPVMITGTVTDQTLASKDTPAISDKDMSAWMEYMYMQRPLPINATGVPVTLTAVGPDGNSEAIGTVNSDSASTYGIAWIPKLEGTYRITATFAGSNSYGSSFSTSYLVVGSAPASPSAAPTPTPTASPTASPIVTPSPAVINPEAVPNTTLYIAVAAVVIIAVIVAIALVLRRHK